MSRQSAHLPGGGDVFFGHIMAGGWGCDGENEKSPVKFNGTLVNLSLIIYTYTSMPARILRCPGFVSEERTAYGGNPHYKDFITLQNMH